MAAETALQAAGVNREKAQTELRDDLGLDGGRFVTFGSGLATDVENIMIAPVLEFFDGGKSGSQMSPGDTNLHNF